ncbi:MAG: YbbR-like domain-containing protein [Silvanigrellaceae bacterium]
MNPPVSILKRVLNFVVHNFGLKLLSLGFAVALFLIVRSQQVREFNRAVRVRLHTENGVIVMGPQERVANITLRMPDTLFSRLPTDEELTGEVDLRSENTGKIRVSLSGENFPNLDRRYSVIVHEPWLDIELDRIIQKKVQVKVVLQGAPRAGFEIHRVAIDPPEIELVGARQDLAKLESISTIPVDVSNLGPKDYTAQAGLALDLGASIKPSTIDKVNVKVSFAEKPAAP